MNENLEFVQIVIESDCLDCFPVMRELRPHLPDALSFAHQVQRQAKEGYQLLAVRRAGEYLVLPDIGFKKT